MRPTRLPRPPRAATLALVAALALLAGACAAATTSGSASDVAGPATFADGEQWHYAIVDDSGATVGVDVFTTHVDGDHYVLEQSYTESNVPAGAQPTTDVTRLTVERATLKPLSGTREIDQRTDQGRVRESYAWSYGTEADGHAVLNSSHTKDGKTEQRTLHLRDHYYDNEASLWLWRTLGFAEGYEAQYVSVNAIDSSQQTVDVRIPQRQAQQVPAGAFDTWRLLIRSGRTARTAWVNATAPHQIVQWDNATVLFRLMP